MTDMSEPQRPNPDALLSEIQRAETKARRGQLKLFFGMCPGVGKTYAMLQAAQQRKAEGVEVVAGVVETHGRAETQALLAGLEVIPRQALDYRGVTITEMDIDAILRRRPTLALVDELAHTNALGSRHPKRYQDVLELLDAGIDVYSTLNVQHLESRNDLVQQITGVAIRETVPDSIIDQADEIELIDITPDRLRQRLTDGKVYLGERAATAAENFFREENLAALREMSLRVTAERVDQELRDAKRAKRGVGPITSAQRLAVAVGPSPFSGSLIRWTRRIAAAMDAPWVAVYVELPDPLTEDERARLTKNLSLARELGAQVELTRGDDVATGLLETAREHNVTQIVVGQPAGNILWDFLRGGSLVTKLMRRRPDIDIHIVRAEKSQPVQPARVLPRLGGVILRDCGWGAATVSAVTLAAWLAKGVIGYQAIGIIYLLTVVILASLLNRWAVLLVATLSAVLWDFLFISPPFTFRIDSLEDRMMFGTYFVVAVLVGRLTNQLRSRELGERKREQRTAALNRLLESVAASTSLTDGLNRAVKEVDDLFHGRTVVLLARADGRIEADPHPASTFQPDEKEKAVAAWAFDRNQPAGRFTDTLPNSTAHYLPLRTTKQPLGVIGVNFTERKTLTLDEDELLAMFASQMAMIVERYQFIENAQLARLTEESERLHRTLLDSVSHELKTPLAVIEAASEGLDVQLNETDVPLGRTFLDEIKQASKRLNRVVSNLLDMTRIETGRVPLNLEWCEPGELLQSAAEQLKNEISRERIQIQTPTDLPLVRLDFGLMEQALCNLLTNAATYSPATKPIRLAVGMEGKQLILTVADQGVGLAPGEETKVFGKFYRGEKARPGGTGLGLSIVQGIVHAHQGVVEVENNSMGGATFTIRLPVETSEQPA